MTNIKWFYVLAGALLVLISIWLLSTGSQLLILTPLFIGVIYVLFGISLIKGNKLAIILKYCFIPVLFILYFMFDSYLMDIPYALRGNIRTFWYTSTGGVCTENTFCWMWGPFAVGIASIISFAAGIMKLIKLSILNKNSI